MPWPRDQRTTWTAFAVGLAVISGCLARGQHDHDHEHDHDHDHDHEEVHHVTPAHKPRDFPTAVWRLREIQREIGAGEEREAVGRDELRAIRRDIAAWLPELAADSDLPEGLWDAVHAESRRLVLLFEAGHDDPAGDQIERSLAALERVVVASDPAWFRKPGEAAEQAHEPPHVVRD